MVHIWLLEVIFFRLLGVDFSSESRFWAFEVLFWGWVLILAPGSIVQALFRIDFVPLRGDFRHLKIDF